MVLFGDISKGVFTTGNFILFKLDQKEMKMKIKGIDMMDKRLENIAKVALTFYYDNTEQEQMFQSINVPKQTALIIK